jgi:4-amino-4-deoxy-L-arabinose transferase-like glycosyltransferase
VGSTLISRNKGAKDGLMAKPFTVVALITLLLGIFLRLYGLGIESIWVDEAFSVRAAGLSVPQIIELSSEDPNPPLYYIALHYWLALLGDSAEVSVRLLSVLFGSLAVFVMYKVGAQLFDRATGALASLILALSAFHVQYSQEARAYSLLSLLTLLSFYFFLKLLRGRNLIASSGYVVCSSLLLYTHVYGLFIIVAQNLYVVTTLLLPNRFREEDKTGFWLWALLQGIIALLFLPGLVMLSSSALNAQVRGWIPEPTMGSLLGYFIEYAGSPPLLALFVLLLLFSIFVSFRSARSRPRNGENHLSIGRDYLLSLWLLTPILLPFVVSILADPMLVDRYTVAASLALYLLVAWGIRNAAGFFSPPAVGKLVTLTAVGAVAVLSLITIQEQVRTADKPQWRDAVAYVNANAESGDLVLVTPGYDLLAFDYYARMPGMEKEPFPSRAGAVTEETIGTLESTVQGRERIWVVLDHFALDERSAGAIEEELAGSYVLAEREQSVLIDVTLWTKQEQ